MARLAPLALATMLAACSGPSLLNGIDRVAGSRGAERVADGIAFGTHGQRLDVWQPAQGRSLRPIVVFLYGGGWEAGRRQDYGFAGRAFASKGFVTIVPDYRKAPANPFPDFMIDAAEAVRWARDHAAEVGGDPDRIALVGHSAGAHIAALLALDASHLTRAGVPTGTVKAGVGLAGPYDFLPFDARQAVAAFGHVPAPEVTQPIRYARADAPPMLLATGDADTVVRPRNSEALAAAITRAGGRASLRIYPGMRHEGIVMALAGPFAGKGPVLNDAATFLSDVMPAK